VAKKAEPSNRTYSTVAEFEKAFFPNSHDKHLLENRSKEPASFGTGLARELLESIKKDLAT
jgi:hypothetical protein